MNTMSAATLAGAVGLAAFATYSAMTTPPPVATAPPAVEIPVVPYKPSWKCPECTDSEKHVLEQIQAKTRITDRNALATIMGNIKQESKFIPNICEDILFFWGTSFTLPSRHIWHHVNRNRFD